MPQGLPPALRLDGTSLEEPFDDGALRGAEALVEETHTVPRKPPGRWVGGGMETWGGWWHEDLGWLVKVDGWWVQVDGRFRLRLLDG